MSICFSKSFLKNFFIYTWANFFSLYYTCCLAYIYPGIFLSLLHVICPCCVNFHVLSNNSYKCINMHMQDSCQKSEIPEYGNLYNYLHLSGIKFALRIIINFYSDQKIDCIQTLYCMQSIYCRANVCGYKLNCLPFRAPF